MTKRSYEQIPCPIAHSLSVLGDQWTLMIIFDALLGISRFDGFQQSLCLSRNLLTNVCDISINEHFDFSLLVKLSEDYSESTNNKK